MADDVGVEAARIPAPAAPRFARLVRSLPDGRLVARVRAGDVQAFDAVYERYHRQLLAFCRHMLGSQEEAEDALQHVFVSAHRHLSSGDRVVDLKPWLYTVARNRCLSVLRARREAVALDDVPEPSTNGLALAAEVEQRQDLKDVLADMARLPDDQREALVLSELGALSHDEIAELLGVRRDKVKALVFQARESLAGWRQARDMDCGVIREQLATLRGGALRRAPLRRHLESCDGCRAFQGEVRRQREAMAVLLPVVPGLALKSNILGAVAVGGASAGGVASTVAAGVAGTTAAGASAGGAAAGGALSALAGKVLIVAAVAGTAGGGYTVVQQGADPAVNAPRPVPPALVAPGASPLSATGTPTPAPALPAVAGSDEGSATTEGRPATPGERRSERAREAAADRKAQRRTDPGKANGADRGRDDRGRPETPGARGLEKALKAQGLDRRAQPSPGARRRSPDRPAPSGDRGSSSTAPGRERSRPTTPATERRPDGATRPDRVRPAPARPVAPETEDGTRGKAGKVTEAVPAVEAVLPAEDPAE